MPKACGRFTPAVEVTQRKGGTESVSDLSIPMRNCYADRPPPQCSGRSRSPYCHVRQNELHRKATARRQAFPRDSCADEVGARVNVADAVAYGIRRRAVKAAAIVGDLKAESLFVFELRGERDVVRLSVARDVVEGFLHDAIKLDLFNLRQLQAVFEVGRAIELISEFLCGGQLGYGVAERPFERRDEADVGQHRRAEVFANVANLVRDAFDLAAQMGGLRQLIGQHQQVAQVGERLIVQVAGDAFAFGFGFAREPEPGIAQFGIGRFERSVNLRQSLSLAINPKGDGGGA